MMMKKMCGVHKAAWALLLVGGVNWLLVGLTGGKDLFMLLGHPMSSWIARAVYLLVGVSAVAMLGLGKCCMGGGCRCGEKGCGHCGADDKGKPMNPEPPKA